MCGVLPIQKSDFMQKSVLFICTGNTCRSPLAEAWFNKIAESENLPYRASSAGLAAVNGAPASNHSQSAAAELGASLENFHSQMVTIEMLKNAELVICMTSSHCRYITSAMPELAEKVRPLMAYCDGGDVSDPYGGTLEEYRQCFAGIRIAVENLIGNLK